MAKWFVETKLQSSTGLPTKLDWFTDPAKAAVGKGSPPPLEAEPGK